MGRELCARFVSGLAGSGRAQRGNGHQPGRHHQPRRTHARRRGVAEKACTRTASPRRWVRTRDTAHALALACFRFASAVNRAGLPPRNYSLAGPVATAALWISGCHRPTMRLSAQRRPTHRSDAVGPRALGPPESKVPPVQCAHRFFFFLRKNREEK